MAWQLINTAAFVIGVAYFWIIVYSIKNPGCSGDCSQGRTKCNCQLKDRNE